MWHLWQHLLLDTYHLGWTNNTTWQNFIGNVFTCVNLFNYYGILYDIFKSLLNLINDKLNVSINSPH